MPIYEYECHNPRCQEDNKPLEFEANQPLSLVSEPAECPKCKDNGYVKKVIRSAVPKSMSWKT